MSDALMLDAHTRLAIIEGVLAKLQDHYVFPDIAKQMEQAIRKRQAAGEYDAITEAEVFCDLLAKHLREVCHDKHLRIVFHAEPKAVLDVSLYDDAAELAAYWAEAALDNYGWHKAERLAGNIGYLQIRSLDEAEETAEMMAAAMTFLSRTSALIIDIRRNSGGAPSGVAFLCSYFFDTQPVHLNDVYCRKDDSTQQFWTFPALPGRRYLNKPVYILTSSRTPSAGEEFAYNLKVLGRAVIVGETTVGAANPVDVYRINPHIDLRVPTCRSINPITKTNWEGVGVTPDIAVPQEEALQVAYREALTQVLKHVEEQSESTLQVLRREIQEALNTVDGS